MWIERKYEDNPSRSNMGGLIVGQSNQIYAKWKRILPSPDNPNELFIVLEKDKPMSKETIKAFDKRFEEVDVIVTVTKLIRGKRKRGKRK